MSSREIGAEGAREEKGRARLQRTRAPVEEAPSQRSREPAPGGEPRSIGQPAAGGPAALDSSTPAVPPSLTRRTLIAGAVGAVGVTIAQGDPVRAASQLIGDTTKRQGRPPNELGERSPAERPRRDPSPSSSRTPLQELHGTITPSDLHFERHHAGVAVVDPDRYSLLVHGMVERPLVFTLDDLMRFPSVSRVYFLECSGNFRRNAPPETMAQNVCGLTSQSEWTGVLLSTLFREVGVLPEATWFLAEGQDGAVMARSIPVTKAWDDAMIAYGQNGEALRPEQGYPARLFNPGWEGNSSVKWLRRIELADGPFMTRDETSRYTDPLADGTMRQFSFVMDARSIITAPSFPDVISPGWNEIRGIAWSGRGRIERVDISFDGGSTWEPADLQEPVLPKAHTRFRYMWNWDGTDAEFRSRATDETGYVQPTQAQLVGARGAGTAYHQNPITGWTVGPDGRVFYFQERWA